MPLLGTSASTAVSRGRNPLIWAAAECYDSALRLATRAVENDSDFAPSAQCTLLRDVGGKVI
ncbi:MAG: hypothetical protein HY207_00605 [Nitrospirae bacterium]|nr:hypothetical protein [Nitrospirota bacterium]